MDFEQLAFWNEDQVIGMPLFDRADVVASNVPEPRVNEYIAINGQVQRRVEYPDFSRFYIGADQPPETLADLPSTAVSCPFCRTVNDNVRMLPEVLERGALTYERTYRQDFCRRCLFWQHTELRTESYVSGDMIFDSHHLAVLTSKLRDFEAHAPDGTLAELAQWFRRHPNLYQSVSPRYLEQLVAKVFSDLYSYVEVTHVGRPDDGGVDVILVEDEGKTWLIQVKRRERATASEPVSTVRHLLGTMLLADARWGAVVSSADHFTHRACEAAATAAKVGYTVHLYDRHAFDRLLGRGLPQSPWSVIEDLANKDGHRWFRTEEQGYKAKAGLIGFSREFASSRWSSWDDGDRRSALS